MIGDALFYAASSATSTAVEPCRARPLGNAQIKRLRGPVGLLLVIPLTVVLVVLGSHVERLEAGDPA